jgi:hypothetical protein
MPEEKEEKKYEKSEEINVYDSLGYSAHGDLSMYHRNF